MGAKCTGKKQSCDKDCYTQDLYIKCPVAGCTKETPTYWECTICRYRVSICKHASIHCGCCRVSNIWKCFFQCEDGHTSTPDCSKLTSALENLTSTIMNDMADSLEDLDLRHSVMTNLKSTKKNTRLFL